MQNPNNNNQQNPNPANNNGVNPLNNNQNFQAGAHNPVNNAAQPLNNNNQQEGDANGGLLGLGMFGRIIILSSILVTLYSQGSVYQVAFVFALVALHYAVGLMRKLNNNRNAQNRENNSEDNQQRRQQRDRNAIKSDFQRKITRAKCAAVEFLICFFLSLFPNWNVTEHYLEKYKEYIDHYKKEIEEPPAFVPEESQQENKLNASDQIKQQGATKQQDDDNQAIIT